MFCSKCGAENEEGARFCKQCGAPLGEAGPGAGPGSRSATTNLEPNVAGLLCYVLGWITGLIFILIEKEDQFVRFHAVQSIMVFGGLTILSIVLSVLEVIPYIGVLFMVIQILVGIAAFILWVFLMIKAYQGSRYKLPFTGERAERYI